MPQAQDLLIADRRSNQQSAISTQKKSNQPPASPAPIPSMGRGMTTDSPAVRRVEQEAQVVPGQEPLVMVKKESPQDAQALSQPAQPVQPEAVARKKIGEKDQSSGRQIVQPSNSELQNERLAAEAAPELATQLSEAAAGVPGARLDRIRPQKNLDRIEEKVKQDEKPPRTIQDYLAGQIAADTPQAKDLLIAQLKKRFKVIGVEDKFLEGRPELAGYPSANVQVQMSNGSTAEVQIVPSDVQKLADLGHHYYTGGRKAELEGNLAARDWNHARAAEINGRALEEFKRRNGILKEHPRSVPQRGAPEGLSHAPPGQIEQAASTGRPNQGGLGVYGVAAVQGGTAGQPAPELYPWDVEIEKGSRAGLRRSPSASPTAPVMPAPPDRQLGPGPPLKLSLDQVLNLRGEARWKAAEHWTRETFGGTSQVHRPVPATAGRFAVKTTGGRNTDVTAPGGGGKTLGIEVKIYQSWRTVEGKGAVRQMVPLTDKIREQVHKDAYLKENDPTFDPMWIFLDAPPSPELAALLEKAGIRSVHYLRSPRK